MNTYIKSSPKEQGGKKFIFNLVHWFVTPFEYGHGFILIEL